MFENDLFLLTFSSYVDSYRMISVSAGSGNADLKSIMASSGRKIRTDDKLAPGEPDLHMYLRLADHLMKKGLIEGAMQSIAEAADFDPESPLVLMAAARCHTMVGHWEGSLQACEAILQVEPKNTKAVLFKAEALFNLCQFEAALMYFHRGQVLNPDLDDFRFGIQKSRKTITDAMKDETVFTFDGVERLFHILRGNIDIQDRTKNASYVSLFFLVPESLNNLSFALIGWKGISKWKRRRGGNSGGFAS